MVLSVMQNLPPKDFVVHPCTHTALAKAYGVSRKVLYTWLRPLQAELGPRQGYKYNIEQLLLIFEKLGWPPNLIPGYGE